MIDIRLFAPSSLRAAVGLFFCARYPAQVARFFRRTAQLEQTQYENRTLLDGLRQKGSGEMMRKERCARVGAIKIDHEAVSAQRRRETIERQGHADDFARSLGIILGGVLHHDGAVFYRQAVTRALITMEIVADQVQEMLRQANV